MFYTNAMFRLVAAAALLALPSCVLPRCYPDIKQHAAAPASVVVKKPVVIDLKVVGKTNGVERGVASRAFTKAITKSLQTIGNITVGSGGGRLDVVAHNYGDTKDAAQKGMASGLTMGIVGVEVVDNYDLTFNYTPAGGSAVTRSYKHSIHSIIGATKSPPEGVKTVGLLQAFQTVIDDVVKSFVADLVKSGKL